MPHRDLGFETFMIHGHGAEISTLFVSPHFYDSNKRYFVTLKKAALSYSWPNVQSPNNAFKLSGTDYTIPKGTWSLSALQTYIFNLLGSGAVAGDFSMTKRAYNGTVKISCANGVSFDTGTFGQLVGYANNIIITDNTVDPISKCHLDPVRSVHIECDLINSNCIVNGVQRPVLRSGIVPILNPYDRFEITSQTEDYGVPLGNYNIHSITCRFTDRDGVLLEIPADEHTSVAITLQEFNQFSQDI